MIDENFIKVGICPVIKEILKEKKNYSVYCIIHSPFQQNLPRYHFISENEVEMLLSHYCISAAYAVVFTRIKRQELWCIFVQN